MKRLLLIPLGVLLLTAGLAHSHGPARIDTRPNIIFLLTDDQDLELNSLAYMPNVRGLIASQGITFSNDFVPLSLCCPSRSSILTGEYTHNHHVYTNAKPDGGYRIFLENGLEDTTIGTALHAAGYRTALMGKYVNAYPAGAENTHVPPGGEQAGRAVQAGHRDPRHAVPVAFAVLTYRRSTRWSPPWCACCATPAGWAIPTSSSPPTTATTWASTG